MKLKDKYGRVHRYLRLSLTDKCNLNCIYCNPQHTNIKLSSRSQLLDFDEIYRVVDIFVNKFEFDKIRLTGGEPFARNDVIDLIRKLSEIKLKRKFELTITTNGTLIKGKIANLREAGLDRINFSLDSLNHENYLNITGKNDLDRVFETIQEAEKVGYNDIKINTVIIKGVNDNEITDFVDYAALTGYNIRFIEFMPFSGNGFENDKFIGYNEIREIVEKKYRLIPVSNGNNEIAKDYLIAENKGIVSFISSISNHFCDGCDRIRITAAGKLKNCLFSTAQGDLDLRYLLRSGFSDDDIVDKITEAVQQKKAAHPELEELKVAQNNNMLQIGG